MLGGSREQVDGGIKYVALNLVSTVLFLTGIGLLYGQTGTLNMADLALATETVDQGLLTVIAMMFMVAFGVKAAVFPLFFLASGLLSTRPPSRFRRSSRGC